jgi:hypothetical protein
MATDPSTLGRGLIFGAAWLVWLLTGYAYVRMHSAIPGNFLGSLSQQEKIILYGWVLVSTVLLFYAVSLTIRGFAGQPKQTRS